MEDNFDATFKAKVVIESLKNKKTTSQISIKYNVPEHLIEEWKQFFMDELPSVFSRKRKNVPKNENEMIEALQKKIQQLNIEVEWLRERFKSNK